MDDNESSASEPSSDLDHGYTRGYYRWHNRVKRERLPNIAIQNVTDRPPVMVVCPYCRRQFIPFALLTLYQVAAFLMVSIGAVRQYVSQGKLKYRLWLRSSRVVTRVVDSRDLDEFLTLHRPYPWAMIDDSPVLRLHSKIVAGSRKGGKASAAKTNARKAAIKAQAAQPVDPNSEPINPPSDPKE